MPADLQGFTDDAAPALISIGASAISSFTHLLVQNEKNGGRYRMIASQGQLAPSRGIERWAVDQRRGAVIERPLCDGHARIGADLAAQIACALQPFVVRGLASLDGEWLTISPDGLPYARTVAALFDPYRVQSPSRLSSAV